MKNDKYFIVISLVAFLSLSYIACDKMVFTKYTDNQFATVAMSSSTATNKVSSSTARSLPPESPINYTDNKNGTVTDNYTGLIWKKCAQGMTGNDCKSGSPTMRIWSEARVECEDLVFAGKKGWRLPTLKELQSIVDTGAFDPSINKKYFVSSDDSFWTLTSPAKYPTSKFTVLFSDGSVYYKDMNNVSATRCVYDGSTK